MDRICHVEVHYIYCLSLSSNLFVILGQIASDLELSALFDYLKYSVIFKNKL